MRFSCTFTTCLKKLVGTKSLNTKQCPARLFPRFILPYLPVISLLPPNLFKKPSSQTFSHFPHRNRLPTASTHPPRPPPSPPHLSHLHPPLSKLTLHQLHQSSLSIKEQFSSNHLFQILFVALFIAVVSFL